MKKKPKKLPSIAKLTDSAATLLQELRRIEDSDDNGYCECATCGIVKHYKDGMQGGHFIERGRLSTKLRKENINPQCAGCNCFQMKKASYVLKYRHYMVARYGEELVLELESLSNNTKKYTRAELLELTALFKSELDTQRGRVNGL